MENPSGGSRKKLGLILALVFVAILSGFLGFFIGNNKPTVIQKYYAPSNQSGSDSWPASIVTGQNATAVGKIVKADASTITLAGADGKEATLKLDPKVNIFTPAASGSGQIKPSSDTNLLQVNKQVATTLYLKNGIYYVTNVTFLNK